MDWTMLGAIGELAGALAVVATLMYLARQIRDSSMQERRSRAAEVRQLAVQVTGKIADNADLADIFLRGAADPEGLSPTEALQFSALLYGMFQNHEAYFHFLREGGVHQYGAPGLERSMRDIVGEPGIQRWWADRKHWFSEVYQREVDGWIAVGSQGFLARYQGLERR